MEPGVLGQPLAPQTFLAGDPPPFTWRMRLGGTKHDWREGAGLEGRDQSLLLMRGTGDLEESADEA